MSLLGIDVGTTGCKAVLFSKHGNVLASAFQEYDYLRPRRGWAELDAVQVWGNVKNVIAEAARGSASNPIEALAVSSLGEALVPVTEDRTILGPSILNFDTRGEEFVERLGSALKSNRLYDINGNLVGNHFSLTKLMWIKTHHPELYTRAYKFIPWSGFVSFMLGAEPVVDYSIANRTLLFDIEKEAWSDELLELAGIDPSKLPVTVSSGTLVGSVSRQIAAELGLPPNVSIVSGAHDQCAGAIGSGAIKEGHAVCSMGTYTCITTVFGERRDSAMMIEHGLNTEHHAVPGHYVSFIYNQGGAMVKWFRDTFAASERREAQIKGEDVYVKLFGEIPDGPSNLFVLPHFTTTGPPQFISDSKGVIVGLSLDTSRGNVLKGILEGITFDLRECVESSKQAGIEIDDFRAVGGGSKSDQWLQICADIMGRPFVRPTVIEAGALGAAIIAGVGTRVFNSYEESIGAMVKLDRTFEPDDRERQRYQDLFEKYKLLWPLMSDYLRDTAHKQQ
ncbi:MAG: hypothetical protein GY847_23960 [Proteobacteria bacterium]|nr:hypothetical protein [Pseudomonadota bacterium]